MTKTDTVLKTKLTKNQALVFNVLSSAAQPLGAYAILDELRSHGFKAPLQVAWTVCCGKHRANPPVFAICNDCGNVTEHFDEELVKNLNTMSARSGFMPDRSVIEIHGQCDDCGADTKQ